ncbi:MAG: hypothetical protein EAZ99_01290 [Alphaproteobacteria bacterium]|nr:MAG: hypothetical protein EAZ99_01290 [Alphaproteobacteria bacterium]
MPVENERKYLLKVEHGPVTAAAERCRSVLGAGTRVEQLQQGWLDGTRARVRRVEADQASVRHVFTWKRMTGGRPIEIEQSIDPEDFSDLFAEAEERLSKWRLTPLRGGDEAWCLDLLPNSDGSACLAIAEVEMPEGRDHPRVLPSWLRFRLVHSVPRVGGWTNQNLAAPGAIDRAIVATRGLERVFERFPQLPHPLMAALFTRLGGPATGTDDQDHALVDALVAWITADSSNAARVRAAAVDALLGDRLQAAS